MDHPIKKCNNSGESIGSNAAKDLALLWYGPFVEQSVDKIKEKFPSINWIILDLNNSFVNIPGLAPLEILNIEKKPLSLLKLFFKLLRYRLDFFIFITDSTEITLLRKLFGCVILPKKFAIFNITEGSWEVLTYWKNLSFSMIEAICLIFILPFCFLIVFLMALYFKSDFNQKWEKYRKVSGNENNL